MSYIFLVVSWDRMIPNSNLDWKYVGFCLFTLDYEVFVSLTVDILREKGQKFTKLKRDLENVKYRCPIF